MSWKVEYIILILVSTIIDYWAGLRIAEKTEKRDRKKYLIVSIISNLGILFGFKYLNFFGEAVNSFFSAWDTSYRLPVLDVLLPVGISFYTFQTLSYSIDVYRGNIKPENHFGKFALYVAFFPQLVAGPIERPGHLIPQLGKRFAFSDTQAASGLKLMLWGFFKKICIADRLAQYVNIVYNDPLSHHGFAVVIATVFFAFQIYCDFSGYSDIAIGAARMMGIDLMRNFRTPYFSRSIGEFWRRWHISLSYWFRDYVYIPLGGSRASEGTWYFNILVTFLLSGLWHGANWTFIIWGGLHGLFIISAHVKDKLLQWMNLNKLLLFSSSFVNIPLTFLLVLIGWVFFRANSVTDAFLLVKNSMNFSGPVADAIIIEPYDFLISWPLILFLLTVEYIHGKYNIYQQLGRFPYLLRWSIYSLFVIMILFLGVFFENQEFIYFQF